MVIGVCEDDLALRRILTTALEREHYKVRATASGVEAMNRFGAEPPDLLILDIGLPDADGRDLCHALRARGITVPVLFLTAYDAVTDKISGFHAGGDDYLTKPFALAELIIRVHALARRALIAMEPTSATGNRPRTRPTMLGGLLDPSHHSIAGDAETGAVRLTPTEFRILAALCETQAVVRRGQLVAAAWPNGARVADNTLDAYVSRLRAKLRVAGRPEEIENVRGVGYLLR